MKNSKIEKILGVTFNNKLNSNGHKSIGKKKVVKEAFINSQLAILLLLRIINYFQRVVL